MKKVIVCTFLIFSFSYGFVDEDLDGVEDSVDKCPNTPFDVLVDETGCPVEEKPVEFNLRLGGGFTNDNSYKNRFLSFLLGVSYRDFYFSISTNYFVYDSAVKRTGLGDTYGFLNYSFLFEDVLLSPGIGVKLPTAENGFSTGDDVSITPSIYIDYLFDSFDTFLYYGYMFRGDRELENSSTLSIGAGYQINQYLYASLSFDTNGSDDSYISLFFQYDISQKYYLILNYSHGVSDFSIDNFLSLKLGVRF